MDLAEITSASAEEKAEPLGTHGDWPKKTFKIPASVRKQASLGIELRDEFGTKAYKERTLVGLKRANQLASGKPVVTMRDLVVMRNWFERHAGDIKGKKFSKTSPTNGWISWLLWGGTEARTWVNRELAAQVSVLRKKVKPLLSSEEYRELFSESPLSVQIQAVRRLSGIQKAGAREDDDRDLQAPASVAYDQYGKGQGYLVKTVLVPAYKGAPKPQIVLSSTEDVYRLLKSMTKLDREHLVLITMDRDCRVTAIVELAIGGVSGVDQDWNKIVGPAIIADARRVIVVHNHPTGATGREGAASPSKADKKFAKDCVSVFEGLNIQMDDFVVVAEDSYVSVLEE